MHINGSCRLIPLWERHLKESKRNLRVEKKQIMQKSGSSRFRKEILTLPLKELQGTARGRGRTYRGSSSQWGYGSYSGSQSNQYLRNLPQPDRKSGQKSAHNWYVKIDKDIQTLIDNQQSICSWQNKILYVRMA